ncbi:helix-turn-helix domain-containing protein [Formicincola oecophyllae]|uniref:Helix-turn-helix domain-containing protein n=1 Tax=Formicincola oecophyllae TaxID=2558361 RepID=A0A4Y6UAV7_9PROT|nr:helix-turn-helix domain-containing protein [Formicincola oecophyllae]QDH14080.1 helix-turn-helix domain-containing protein [Formicincola oecophyllae]
MSTPSSPPKPHRPSPLAERVAKRMKALNLNQATVARTAGVSRTFVSGLLSGKSTSEPRRSNVERLAKVLKCSVQELYYGEQNPAPLPPTRGSMPTRQIEVRGSVQAGLFTDALEWSPLDWFSITSPAEDGYPANCHRYGLLVRGASMNRLFPEGSIISVIDFDELGREPQTGECVVVLRRSETSNAFEATVKAYQRRPDGTILLWPRSDDPEFQNPFIIPPISADFNDQAAAPDIRIAAVVVCAVRLQPRVSFDFA